MANVGDEFSPGYDGPNSLLGLIDKPEPEVTNA